VTRPVTRPAPPLDEVQLALLEAGDPIHAAWAGRQGLVLGPRLTFRVLGHPVTKAGIRVVPAGNGRRAIGTGGKGLEGWQVNVAAGAYQARTGAGWPTLEGPVGVDLAFQYVMPAGRPKWWRSLGMVPRGTGDDIDKLARAVLDGIAAGGLIRDDRQVAYLVARKDEVADGWEGVEVTVRAVPIARRGAA
jgi:Holliday junction resolvase RusA-like endonuclease